MARPDPASPRAAADVRLRAVTDLAEARALAPELDRHAAEALAEFRDTALPERCTEGFLARHFEAPETLLLVAERDRADGGGVERLGACLVGPLEDPLTGERVPTILLLAVRPAERHRGLAGRLVGAAERALRERGLDALGARAGHNDDALISMGERWGFVRLWEFMVRE